MKKIGIFGGSFDPVHFGHICLAKDAARLESLDKVLFVPARAVIYLKYLPMNWIRMVSHILI